MKAPLLAVIKGLPIVDMVEAMPPFRWWNQGIPGSPDDLWDLETGCDYWLNTTAPCSLNWCGLEYPLLRGWNRITWRPWVMFVPGRFLAEAHWSWAVSVLERVGLDRLLGVADIRLVKVCSEQEMRALVYYPLRGTIYQAWRALLFLDVPPDPPNTVFAEMIAHECKHMLQEDRGFRDGWRKDEFQAYTISDLVHLCAGDGLEVFNSPAYVQAYELGRAEWL